MIKKMLLVFLCLSLFLSIPGCKKKLPTQPDIPTKILPTIAYFTANPTSITLGESSTLSWSVSNVTTITIDQGIGTVSATGTTEVSPQDSTIYTLTAKNNDGQKTQSCTVEITLNPPTIEYFTATPESIMLDSYSTLSWSTTNATTITCSNIFGSLPATGTMEVSPSETTTYTLTANNNGGQDAKSCVVEIKKWAILDISTDPENINIYYDSWNDSAYTDPFTIFINESNGVGGEIYSVNIGTFINSDLCRLNNFGSGRFASYGMLSIYCARVYAPCKLTLIIIYIEGVDDNGYVIEEAIWFTITWTQNTGTMSLLKIVEGQNHHKLIK